MGLELGHSRNYIRNMTSGRSLTSVHELNICEYLNVQPSAFFDEDKEECLLVQRALEGMCDLPDKALSIATTIVENSL